MSTSRGRAGYADIGTGPPVLFLHGLGTSGLLWRNAIGLLRDERRCVALDLPLHGRSPGGPHTDVSPAGLAAFVEAFCDALGLGRVDLVAHDTGGAVAQVFAATRPERLRTLALTDCDTEGNLPPTPLLPVVVLARMRLLAPLGRWLIRDPRRARRAFFGSGYEDVASLPLEVVQAHLTPLLGGRDSAREYQRWVGSLDDSDLRAVAPRLRALTVPTALIWGTADRFFPLRWAERLCDTIPGATDVREVPGARLFFPDERAAELVGHLRTHWAQAGAAARREQHR